MTRALALLGLAAAVAATPAAAQRFRVGVFAADVQNREVEQAREADGLAFGIMGQWHPGRIRVAIDVATGTLDPATGSGFASFDLRELDLRVEYQLNVPVAVEIGAFRRSADPELFAQDVGALRVGAVTRNHIAGAAMVWVRGAYLVVPRFSGGGDAGFAAELGLGTEIATRSGRFAATADYTLQRIDRTVSGQDADIQYSRVRLGVLVGF